MNKLFTTSPSNSDDIEAYPTGPGEQPALASQLTGFDRRLDEVLALLREQADRLTAIEQRLGTEARAPDDSPSPTDLWEGTFRRIFTGMLEFARCQSLEKLVLDHELIQRAQRLARGFERRDDLASVEVVEQGLAGPQFLSLDHTRRWFREELGLPGPASDRQVEESWLAEGGRDAAQRGREALEKLEEASPGCPLDPALSRALEQLALG